MNGLLCATSRKLGLIARMEPSTFSLLNSNISPQQVAQMFTAKANSPTSAEVRRIYHLLQNPNLSREERIILSTQQQRAMKASMNVGEKALRPVTHILSDHQEMILDISIIATGSKSKRVRQLGYLANVHNERARHGLSAKDCPFAMQPSRSIKHAQDKKHRKYDQLMLHLQVEKQQHKRQFTPTFLGLIISHHGELSPDFLHYIDTLTLEESRRYRASPQFDGTPPKQHAARFRQGLLHSIYARLALGWGQCLRSVGFCSPACQHQ